MAASSATTAPIAAFQAMACSGAKLSPHSSLLSPVVTPGSLPISEFCKAKGRRCCGCTIGNLCLRFSLFSSSSSSASFPASNVGDFFVPRCWRFQHHKLKYRNVRMHLKIDRRHYFDESLRRQQEEEDREAEAEITCPVDCVREVRNYAEFEKILHEAELTNTLVVVDFYNSSCGSCKYILPQFIKLCKRGYEEECPVEEEKGELGVQFIKHNVRDDYDDLTDLAKFYSIRTVPMFSFFVEGSRVEQFPTRDRRKLELSVQRLMGRLSK